MKGNDLKPSLNFDTDNLRLGLHGQHVPEVIQDLAMNDVPLAHAAISVLINMNKQSLRTNYL